MECISKNLKIGRLYVTYMCIFIGLVNYISFIFVKSKILLIKWCKDVTYILLTRTTNETYCHCSFTAICRHNFNSHQLSFLGIYKATIHWMNVLWRKVVGYLYNLWLFSLCLNIPSPTSDDVMLNLWMQNKIVP